MLEGDDLCRPGHLVPESGPAAASFRPRNWSGKRDSNPRPSAWKADALPLSYSRSTRCLLVRWWRGEDSNLRRHRRQIYSLFPLTTRVPLHVKAKQNKDPPRRDRVKLAKGLEPPTTSLQMRCSTS